MAVLLLRGYHLLRGATESPLIELLLLRLGELCGARWRHLAFVDLFNDLSRVVDRTGVGVEVFANGCTASRHRCLESGGVTFAADNEGSHRGVAGNRSRFAINGRERFFLFLGATAKTGQ